jgi:hypothetical protein
VTTCSMVASRVPIVSRCRADARMTEQGWARQILAAESEAA